MDSTVSTNENSKAETGSSPGTVPVSSTAGTVICNSDRSFPRKSPDKGSSWGTQDSTSTPKDPSISTWGKPPLEPTLNSDGTPVWPEPSTKPKIVSNTGWKSVPGKSQWNQPSNRSTQESSHSNTSSWKMPSSTSHPAGHSSSTASQNKGSSFNRNHSSKRIYNNRSNYSYSRSFTFNQNSNQNKKEKPVTEQMRKEKEALAKYESRTFLCYLQQLYPEQTRFVTVKTF